MSNRIVVFHPYAESRWTITIVGAIALSVLIGVSSLYVVVVNRNIN